MKRKKSSSIESNVFKGTSYKNKIEHKENIIKWMARRIKDEQRKHESFDENWHEIAARKLYATYNITLKPDIKVDECECCNNFECNK